MPKKKITKDIFYKRVESEITASKELIDKVLKMMPTNERAGDYLNIIYTQLEAIHTNSKILAEVKIKYDLDWDIEYSLDPLGYAVRGLTKKKKKIKVNNYIR